MSENSFFKGGTLKQRAAKYSTIAAGLLGVASVINPQAAVAIRAFLIAIVGAG